MNLAMHRINLGFVLLPAICPGASSPFVGHWDFNVKTPGRDVGANWLGVADKSGTLEIWWQPAGGNVYQVKDFKTDGKPLTLTLNPKLTWDLEAPGGSKLIGTQKNGDKSQGIEGVRSPDLIRPEPKAWSTPEPLFNGKDLTGWEPIGDPAKSHWKVEDGMLVNAEHGANLLGALGSSPISRSSLRGRIFRMRRTADFICAAAMRRNWNTSRYRTTRLSVASGQFMAGSPRRATCHAGPVHGRPSTSCW